MVACISCQVQMNIYWYLNKQKCLNFKLQCKQGFCKFLSTCHKNKEVINHRKPKRGSLMHSNIMSYLKVRSGRCGSSGFLSILGGEKKRREKGELVGSYQNKSCSCFLPVPSQPLESILYCSRLSQQRLVLCKKKFTHLVQSEKAATVIAVMSSTSAHLLSRGYQSATKQGQHIHSLPLAHTKTSVSNITNCCVLIDTLLLFSTYINQLYEHSSVQYLTLISRLNKVEAKDKTCKLCE